MSENQRIHNIEYDERLPSVPLTYCPRLPGTLVPVRGSTCRYCGGTVVTEPERESAQWCECGHLWEDHHPGGCSACACCVPWG